MSETKDLIFRAAGDMTVSRDGKTVTYGRNTSVSKNDTFVQSVIFTGHSATRYIPLVFGGPVSTGDTERHRIYLTRAGRVVQMGLTVGTAGGTGVTRLRLYKNSTQTSESERNVTVPDVEEVFPFGPDDAGAKWALGDYLSVRMTTSAGGTDLHMLSIVFEFDDG
jgi:hypothetical protein